MSKEAAVRAMREARYNRQAAKSTAVDTPRRPEKVDKVVVAPPAAPAASTDGLCGHRSMNGRTCTREQGHEAKSHRYS